MYKIPDGFYIGNNQKRIYKIGEIKDERIASSLLFPIAIIKNLDDGTEKVDLLLEKKNGEIKEGIFSKGKIYSSPLELANFGASISNFNRMGKYLAELEADNEEKIPVIYAVSKLGWRNGAFIPFSNDANIIVDLDYKLEKWLKAYTSKGQLNEWIEQINPFRENNKFRFILASSFAAPLLELIGHRIFIVYNWGDSRGGKSAALKSALSVWGNPEDLTLTFNTTAVGIERLAGLYNDLPLGLDEKQVNKSQTNLEQIIYMLGNGISRIRGNKTGGVQPINTWKTVVLATGEETISTSKSTTGIQTRCLEIEGSPFDGDEAKASEMYSIIANEYGTAGPYYINKIIEDYKADNYKELKQKYNEVFEKIKADTSNDISSYISSVAVVTLADIIVSKTLFNEESEEASYKMAKEILENLDKSKDIDIVDKCYAYISSWIKANHKYFDRYKTTRDEQEEMDDPENDLKSSSSSRTLGLYDDNSYFVFRYALEDKLASKGYSYRTMTRKFAERGYIIPTVNANGEFETATVLKKYRKRATRFFQFPVDIMEDIEEKERTEEREEIKEAVQNAEKEQIEQEKIIKNVKETPTKVEEQAKKLLENMDNEKVASEEEIKELEEVKNNLLIE